MLKRLPMILMVLMWNYPYLILEYTRIVQANWSHYDYCVRAYQLYGLPLHVSQRLGMTRHSRLCQQLKIQLVYYRTSNWWFLTIQLQHQQWTVMLSDRQQLKLQQLFIIHIYSSEWLVCRKLQLKKFKWIMTMSLHGETGVQSLLIKKKT